MTFDIRQYMLEQNDVRVEAINEIGVTPNDIASVLKRLKFSDSGIRDGRSVWQSPSGKKPDVDVEVKKDGSWEIWSTPISSMFQDKLFDEGKGSAKLVRALKKVFAQGNR